MNVPNRLIVSGMLLCLLMFSQVSQAAYDHSRWHQLLQAHVQPTPDGGSTMVDYAGMAAQSDQLQQYLDGLSAVTPTQFDQWPKQERLAFLINAYNAWTVSLILTAYPDLNSIRDLGSLFRSPWKKAFIPLLGQTLSLDNIEHDMIRAEEVYKEPRIHFAVNCASIGCPALRTEAYTGEALEQQLEEQTVAFLSDRSRNRVEAGELKVSAIFTWYQQDFEKGWGGYGSLQSFFVQYASALGLSDQQVRALADDDMEIGYLPYDWQLNDVQR